jgi:hypothetical protein
VHLQMAHAGQPQTHDYVVDRCPLQLIYGERMAVIDSLMIPPLTDDPPKGPYRLAGQCCAGYCVCRIYLKRTLEDCMHRKQSCNGASDEGNVQVAVQGLKVGQTGPMVPTLLKQLFKKLWCARCSASRLVRNCWAKLRGARGM